MNLPSTITLTDYLGKNFEFKTLETLEIFLKKHYDFWMQHQDILNQNPHALQILTTFNNIPSLLSTFTAWKPQIESWDINTFNSNFTNQINSSLSNRWLWNSHPLIQKWIELNQQSAIIADAFFEAIVQKTTSRFSNGFDFFQGYLIAYEYVNQNNTDINRRRQSEKKSLQAMRDQLLKKHNEIIESANSFQSDLIIWNEKVKADFSKWFDATVLQLDAGVLMHSKNFHEQLAVWTGKHHETENKFREKLRFEGAATYWAAKVKTFRKQGYGWGAFLFVSLVIGICLFSNYFLAWLEGQPTRLGIQSIEGIVIFATVLSSYAFLIKSLSKLTFSAFHLQRDAEEREQLTHLYLSLRDSAHDDTESRKIILQALFSRSDTGLLAGDHSPTMPSIQDVIKFSR